MKRTPANHSGNYPGIYPPAIYGCLLTLALTSACAKGTGSDFGIFGNTVGDPSAGSEPTMGDDGGDDGGDDAQDPGDDPAPDDDGASGPAGGGDDAPDDGPGLPGDCCTGHGGMGCDDASVASCVCAQDPFCCESAWDAACAGLVDSLGCGNCGGAADGADGGSMPGDDGGSTTSAGSGGSASGGGGGGNVGDCCLPNNSVGCDDAMVESCVCAADDYCCTTDWDSICVELVDSEGCGDCGGGGGGTSGGGGGAGDCCAANGSVGCDDAAVETCVCASDGYCCSTDWDALCVDEVDSFACGSCGGAGMPSACCSPSASPGCASDPAVQSCVCLSDPFCCSDTWDQLCADEVTSSGCGIC